MGVFVDGGEDGLDLFLVVRVPDLQANFRDCLFFSVDRQYLCPDLVVSVGEASAVVPKLHIYFSQQSYGQI
jgi:hypothetical protein